MCNNNDTCEYCGQNHSAETWCKVSDVVAHRGTATPDKVIPSPDADFCDGDCNESGPCYRLDLGAGGAVFLCRADWAKEMEFRKERNAELEAYAQFDILPWPGA